MSPTDEVPITSDRGTRAVGSRLFGLAFLPVWASSATLAVCLFLPVCLLPGCDSTPTHPISPYEFYEGVESPRELLVVTALIQWPYLFGLLVCGATLFIAATGQARHFRALWFSFAGIIAVSSIGLWWQLGGELRDEKNAQPFDALRETLIVIVPTVLFCVALVVTYFNCRTWLAAATWMQLTLAAYGFAWFTLVDYAFPLLWGGRLSQAACLALVVASLVERRRAFKTLGVRPP